MPSFKEYRYSSTLRYKLVEFIYLWLHLLILMKKESVLRMITSVSARREQQRMNGEPEIKHNSIFISSLPEPRLETLFHTDFILLRGPFLWSQTFLLNWNISAKYFKSTFTQLNSCDLLKQIDQMIHCDGKALQCKPVTSKGFFMDTEIWAIIPEKKVKASLF